MQGLNVIIVEDDAVDAKALRRAFLRRAPSSHLSFAKDGLEALELLRESPPPEPRLMLLDLNMPRLGGLDLLEELRGDPAYRNLRVIALTTSRNSQEMFKAEALGVEGYLAKEDLGTSYDSLFRLLDRLYEGGISGGAAGV